MIRSLHEAGYTYNGDARIGGLTPAEFEVLTLGQLVRKEQQEAAVNGEGGGGRRRQYTNPRMSTREAKRAYQQQYGVA